MKTKEYSDCRVERRRWVRPFTLDMSSGVMFPKGDGYWETKTCAIPLFRDDHRAIGICRSCATGWVHEHSYPTEAGLALLAEHGLPRNKKETKT